MLLTYEVLSLKIDLMCLRNNLRKSEISVFLVETYLGRSAAKDWDSWIYFYEFWLDFWAFDFSSFRSKHIFSLLHLFFFFFYFCFFLSLFLVFDFRPFHSSIEKLVNINVFLKYALSFSFYKSVYSIFFFLVLALFFFFQTLYLLLPLKTLSSLSFFLYSLQSLAS